MIAMRGGMVWLALVCGCCGGGSPAVDASLPDGGAPAEDTAEGPRELPGTFVALELDDFAGVHASACGGPVSTVVPGEDLDAFIDAAPDGATVDLLGATFALDFPLYLGRSDICVRNGILDGGGRFSGPAIRVTGDRVGLEELTIRNVQAGIGLDGRPGETQHEVSIHRVTIEDFVRVDALSPSEGIVVYADNGGPGALTPVLRGLTLTRVTMSHPDMGISCNVGPCRNLWIERASVTGSAFLDPGNDTGLDLLAVESGAQIAVVYSTFRHAIGDGIDLKAPDVVLHGADMREIARNGIKLWYGGDVINSIVSGAGADASLIGENAGRYRYLHSVIADHRGTGYLGTWGYPAAPGIELEFVNTIFHDNGERKLYVPATGTATFDHTIFNGPFDAILDHGDVEVRFADIDGADNLRIDPLLDADFSALDASPVVDAAAPTGVAWDLAGRPRLQGAGPDIGPRER